MNQRYFFPKKNTTCFCRCVNYHFMRETKLEVCYYLGFQFTRSSVLAVVWSCSKPKLVLSVNQLQLFCNLPPLLFDQFNYSLAKSSQNQTDLRRSDLPAMETTMDVSVAVQSHCSAISWTTLFYQSALSHPKPTNVHVST